MHVDQGGVGPIGFATATAMVIGTTSTLQASAQFRTCTGCHELLDPADPAGTVAATATHTTAVTPTGSIYTITDTHFAQPGSFTGLQGANVLDVSGYAMDYASERVCIDCHNPHKPADINREWAQSRHAEKGASFAWAHYNWSCDDGSNCGGQQLFGSRTTCQRCHTTTGFAAYANALGAGNTALADSIWSGSAPPLKPYNPNFKPEMLECAGCHTDNKGTVRNPGAYKASYKIPAGGFPPPFIMPTTADVSYQYPDITASNVCMPCHTGRMSGKAIQNLNTGQTATANFGNLAYSTIDGHYLTAGGTVFRGTAYEYAGRNYTDPASYKHDDIGTLSAPNTGTNGPCVGCHMDRPGLSANHLFSPVGKDGDGKITTVSSEVCFVCHAGSANEFGQIVEEEKEVFEAAMSAFDGQLLVSGFTFTTSFPYFNYSYWLSPGDTDATGNMTGKNNIGAAFNFSLLHHEPGAFVHNSRYVKRLMYDSIDWLDDNNMNYSVGLTIQAMSTFPTPTYQEGAMRYLLNQASYDSGGNIIPGIPAERP
jgi:hypothetical protein